MLRQTKQADSAQIKHQLGGELQALLTDFIIRIEGQTLVIFCLSEGTSDNLMDNYSIFQEDPYLKASTIRSIRHEYDSGSTILPLNNPNFP